MSSYDSKVGASVLAFLGTQKFYRLIAIFLALLFFLTALKSLFADFELHAPDSQYEASPSSVDAPVDQDLRFAFVLPVTAPSPELCKNIFSALSLGYPSPVVVNWGVDYHDISHWELGKNLPKIPGFVQYLDGVMHPNASSTERLQDHDIVLMVDAYDAWFQLPAQVLLSRYHEINRKANERFQQEWTGKGPVPWRQTIVVASQKKCYPENPERYGVDLLCEEWPESPLREDLYGPDTEKNYTNYHDNRPRWINGGMYIGPAGDMRRLFRRSLNRMEELIGQGVQVRSEQGMVGVMLGEQEVWRQWRKNNPKANGRLVDFMERDFEYSMGVDYGQDIVVQTHSTKINKGYNDDLYDGDFVALGNQTAIDQHSKTRGISPVRLRGLPDDIKAAPNPLSTLDKAANWTKMRLYADFFTESVPAILHQNGFKFRRRTMWNRPWYYQRLRGLLQASLQLREPDDPLVTLKLEGGHVRYWAVSAEATDRLPRRFNGTAYERYSKMEFEDICRYPDNATVPRGYEKNWWDEVFRDNNGPLSFA
ncbi:hypothetical protein FHETE_10424 [Fusarium heterosporum]|uniref:Uncharacterized protein n=1 Tax=Fusarium heterosporum TaxID=42747 RepID=A0A8H5WGP4_FUSHE|nr:hypothetical protein FHETE_10424 [Fusarium heterosporum]